MSALPTIYRYCPWALLNAALGLGWRIVGPLHQPHATYVCLVEWPHAHAPQWPEAEA